MRVPPPPSPLPPADHLEGSQVWHILDIIEGSPAQDAGLVPFGDWVIGYAGGVLRGEQDLYRVIEAHEDRPLRLFVYNADYEVTREVVIVPNVRSPPSLSPFPAADISHCRGLGALETGCSAARSGSASCTGSQRPPSRRPASTSTNTRTPTRSPTLTTTLLQTRPPTGSSPTRPQARFKAATLLPPASRSSRPRPTSSGPSPPLPHPPPLPAPLPPAHSRSRRIRPSAKAVRQPLRRPPPSPARRPL